MNIKKLTKEVIREQLEAISNPLKTLKGDW
jgi:hypothetical protein